MGAVLGCFALVSNTIKKKDSKKKEQSPKEPQPLPPQAPSLPEAPSDLQHGLQDDHLSSVPPPAPEQAAVTGTEEVSREVATTAPVSVPTFGNAESGRPLSSNTRPDIRTILSRSFSQQLELEKQSEGEAGLRNSRMASDEDYAAFLDKANKDPNEGTAKTQGKGKMEFKATDEGVKVPAGLKKATADAFYVSDADEPFEPVALKFDGKKLPDEVTFAKLINHPSPSSAEVDIMDIGEWDTQGQYKDIVEAVRAATKGSDIRVYRVAKDGTRVEYWLVGFDGLKLVGAKALAVES